MNSSPQPPAPGDDPPGGIPPGALDPTIPSPHLPPDRLESAPGARERAGARIGRYRLLEMLGEGGFGSVWRAVQQEPIHREVALKVIKPGMDSAEITARFAAERQALAMMEHPHIAAVLDAGATEDGRPYFAMELVRGQPITAFCDEKQLTVRQRLALFLSVCQAIQHAHQKGILHRDLKPSNILVEEVDAAAVPKVIDFGIAKALGAGLAPQFDATLARTREGMVIGTPQYMSPEQAGSRPDVDTRSDIYTLGVILHELLTGSPPLPREVLRQAGWEEMLRLVREEEVRRPSSSLLPATEAITALADRRRTTARRLGETVRGELDWILLKALDKDRERRYPSATALAEDLHRYLRDEPVLAGPPARTYALRKFLRRHRGPVAAAVAVFLCILAGLIVSGVLYQREKNARGEAVTARRAAEQLVNDVLFDLHRGLRQAGRLELLKKAADSARDYLETIPETARDVAARRQRAAMLLNLSEVFREQGDQAASHRLASQALEEFRAIAAAVPDELSHRQNVAAALERTGIAQFKLRNYAAALPDFRAAEQVRRDLLALAPENTRYAAELSVVLAQISHALLELKRMEEARPLVKEGITLSEKNLAGEPQSAGHRRDAANAWSLLCKLEREAGHPGEAETACRKTLGLLEPEINAARRNYEVLATAAVHYNTLREILLDARRWQEAEAAGGEALRLFEELTGHDDRNGSWQFGLSTAAYGQGQLALRRGDRDRAAALFRRAAEAAQPLAADNPANADWTRGAMMAWNQLAELCVADQDWPRAEDAASRSVDLARRRKTHSLPGVDRQAAIVAQEILAKSLLMQDKLAEAEAGFVAALEEVNEALTSGEQPAVMNRNRMVLSTHLSQVKQERGLPGEAAAIMEGLLEECRRKTKETPADADLLKDAGAIADALCTLMRTQDRPADAEAAAAQSLTWLRAARALRPDDAEIALALCRGLEILEGAFASRKEWSSAEPLAREWMQTADKLVAEHPNHTDGQVAREKSRSELAALLRKQNRPTEGRIPASEGIAIVRRLRQQSPESSRYRRHLLLLLETAADCEIQSGPEHHPAARLLLDEAEALLTEMETAGNTEVDIEKARTILRERRAELPESNPAREP